MNDRERIAAASRACRNGRFAMRQATDLADKYRELGMAGPAEALEKCVRAMQWTIEVLIAAEAEVRRLKGQP